MVFALGMATCALASRPIFHAEHVRRADVAFTPPFLVFADGGAAALHAFTPPFLVFADGGATAVHALMPIFFVFADGGAAAVHA